MLWAPRKQTSLIRSLRSDECGCASTGTSLQQLWETTMNHSIIFRPLASAAVLALVAVSQPGFAALSQAASLLPPQQAAVQVELEGRITAVNAAAGTITIQDDNRPATVVALGAARGPYYLWQKVKVYGIVTNAATMRAQVIKLKS
jgi:hypothetical protein